MPTPNRTPTRSSDAGVPRTPAPAPPKGPAPLRATFRLLETAAPSVAAALAERLWFRLPPRPSDERRARHAPPGGRRLTVEWTHGALRGVTYGPTDAPTAYLVHGWGGWWQQLGAHVEPLLDAGYRVVAYDAPSHGASDPGGSGPRSTSLIEMAEGLTAVVRQEGPADLVVAHSVGAVVSLWSAADHGADDGAMGEEAPDYAFIAPASTLLSMVQMFERSLDVGRRSQSLLLQRVEQRFHRSVDEFEIVNLAARVLEGATTRQPGLLTVHDPMDHETPVSGSLRLAESWPEAELSLVSGLGHRRLLWDPDVVASVADFAKRRLHR